MAADGSHFRSYVWDPILIISQIIAVQFTFYLFLGFWLFGLDNISGRSLVLSQLFDGKQMSFSNSSGRITLIAFALNSLTSSIALWFIVQRAKQPCVSVGLVGQLTVDLLLNNISDVKKVGYFYSKCFTSVIGSDPFEDDSSNICSSCEVFESKAHRLVIIQQRAPFIKGRIPLYRRKLIEWIKDCSFKQILILGSCSSHVINDISTKRNMLFYLLSKQLSNFEEKLLSDFKWKKFEHKEENILDEVTGNEEIYIPGGGIMKSLHNDCCSNDIPSAALLALNSDGNGIHDAFQLVQDSWQIPSSWNGINAMPRVPNIY
eukprot:gene18866-20766_t